VSQQSASLARLERPRRTEPTAIRCNDVSVWVANGPTILNDLSWEVGIGEHWALLGPNGAGKTTLLSLAGAARHPSAGTFHVFDQQFGKVDMASLRRQIGVVDPNFKLLEWLTVEDVVLTGISGTIRPLWDQYGQPQRARAHRLLRLLGCEGLADREIIHCSQGERQRVRIARSLMPEPRLLLLDEPSTGLDFPAREALLEAMTSLAAAHPALTTVNVTHHLEELPVSTTHALLLKAGNVTAAGPIGEVLTSEQVSACYGFNVTVQHDAGRWSARAAANWAPAGP